jgi:hypothetical protein
MLAGLKDRHYIGRQAPVKRCLARLRGLRPAVLRLNSGNRVEDCAEIQRKNLQAVGKHLLHGSDVDRVHERQLFQLAHTTLSLGAGEMALAGMHANDFAGPGDFKALGGAAMRFQFFLWLSRVSRHCWNSPKSFLANPNR